jgi:glutathione S-transferase
MRVLLQATIAWEPIRAGVERECPACQYRASGGSAATFSAANPIARRRSMKLYFHPVSTTSRPIVLFAQESGIDLDYEVVDLFTGAQYGPAFSAINPSHQVPVLEDGDFRLTESSAILKYLADKTGSAAYPKDLRARARVNERMDWFNTGFYRDYSYGFIYPQIFPFMKRADEVVQAGTIAYGKEKAQGWLKILDEHVIGPRNRYVCGNDITIADYLGAVMIIGGEAITCNLGAYPNISRWLDAMKSLPHWAKVNEVFYQAVVTPNKGKAFVAL